MNRAPSFLVIPAAGLGTRMKAVSSELPKEMLAVCEKPAIQYSVAEGYSVGIKKIIIIINHKKKSIRRYFEEQKFQEELYPQASHEMRLFAKECKISFLYQPKPKGEADAIGLCRDLVGGSDLAIIYPDNLYFPAPGALKYLLSYFNRTGKDLLALTEVTAKNQAGISNAGRVDLRLLEDNLFDIENFLPKADGPFIPRFPGELRTCGIMLTSGSYLFNYIEQARKTIRDEEFTDTPVRRLIMKDKGLLGCRLPGVVFDIGNPIGYEICQQFMVKQKVNNS